MLKPPEGPPIGTKPFFTANAFNAGTSVFDEAARGAAAGKDPKAAYRQAKESQASLNDQFGISVPAFHPLQAVSVHSFLLSVYLLTVLLVHE